MKRKWLQVSFLCMMLGLLLFCCTRSDQVFATDNLETVAVNSGLHSEQHELDSYQSYVFEETNWFSGISRRVDAKMASAFNFVANLLFSLNKMLFSLFDYIIAFFNEKSLIDSGADSYMSMSSRIYQGLFSKFGLTIFALVALWIFYLYLFESPQKALRTFWTFFLVFIISFGINQNGASWLKGFNNISNEISNSIVEYADSNTEYSGESGTTSIRNTLFDISVKEPYYLMNYNELASDKINTTEFPKRADSLLVKKGEKMLTDDEVENLIKETDSENLYLTGAKTTDKIIVAGTSILVTTAIGLPIALLQLMNFLLEIVILLFSSMLGIFLLLALIPALQRFCWNVFRFLISIFGFKILLGFAMLLLLGLFSLTRTLIPSENFITYFIQIILYTIILICLWVFRKPLARVLMKVKGGQSFGSTLSSLSPQRTNRNRLNEDSDENREENSEFGEKMDRLIAALEAMVGLEPEEERQRRNSLHEDEMDTESESFNQEFTRDQGEQEKRAREEADTEEGFSQEEKYTKKNSSEGESNEETESRATEPETDVDTSKESVPEEATSVTKDEVPSEVPVDEEQRSKDGLNESEDEEIRGKTDNDYGEPISEDNRDELPVSDTTEMITTPEEVSPEDLPETLQTEEKEKMPEAPVYDPAAFELNPEMPVVNLPEQNESSSESTQGIEDPLPQQESLTGLPDWQTSVHEDLEIEQMMEQTYQKVENEENQIHVDSHQEMEQAAEQEKASAETTNHTEPMSVKVEPELQPVANTDFLSLLNELRGASE